MRANAMMIKHYYRIILLCIIISCVGLLTGCFYQYIEFKPTYDKNPIILFDKYQVYIRGFGAGSRIDFEFELLQSVYDTTNLDSIPILLLDSVCFRDECLDGDYCSKPQSWYAKGQENYRKGHGGGYDAYLIRREKPYLGGYPVKLIRDKDLFFMEGRIVSGGFELSNGPGLPESCYKSEVTVELWFRLLDRITGDEISNETTIIPFRIKRGRHFGGLS